jgi:phosphatidylserine/phosphatidylglycerophosphate/cardiolipin synthase-like enzyme
MTLRDRTASRRAAVRSVDARRTRISDRLHRLVAAAARLHPSTIETLETDGNRVERMSVGGVSIAEDLYDLISTAQHEVFINTMIMQDSRLAARVRDAVHALARTRPHVPVHIMVQSFRPRWHRSAVQSVFTRRSVFKDRLVSYFDSPNVRAAVWNPRSVGKRWSLQRLLGFHVLHSKGAVVDNRRAITMDTNLEAAVDPVEEGGDDWFQTAFLVEGPVAASMREEQASAWRITEPDVTLPDAPPIHEGVEGGSRAIALGQEGGTEGRSSANEVLLASLRAGEPRIVGFSPNLNDAETVRTLAEATASTHVYLVLSRGFEDFVQTFGLQGGGNEVNIRRLAARAANPARLHVRWFPESLVRAAAARVAALGLGKGANHAKVIAVGPLVLATTKNLDTQAAQRSRESGIAFFDRSTSAAVHRLFRQVWAHAPTAFEGGDKI